MEIRGNNTLLKITSINGIDLTKCKNENGVNCKNSYPCRADNELKCGIGCVSKEECENMEVDKY